MHFPHKGSSSCAFPIFGHKLVTWGYSPHLSTKRHTYEDESLQTKSNRPDRRKERTRISDDVVKELIKPIPATTRGYTCHVNSCIPPVEPLLEAFPLEAVIVLLPSLCIRAGPCESGIPRSKITQILGIVKSRTVQLLVTIYIYAYLHSIAHIYLSK